VHERFAEIRGRFSRKRMDRKQDVRFSVPLLLHRGERTGILKEENQEAGGDDDGN
jgi:hypothetical protein